MLNEYKVDAEFQSHELQLQYCMRLAFSGEPRKRSVIMDAGLYEITFRLRLFVIYNLGALRSSRAATCCLVDDGLPSASRPLVRACNDNVSVLCPTLK